MYGKWTTTPKQYVEHVSRYSCLIGQMDWAASQDWMCEPSIRKKTGLSVSKHQVRTIDNYIELKTLAPELPFVPVLQGWKLTDYHRHVEMYVARGIDLGNSRVVGVGSVCRRQSTPEGVDIFKALSTYGFRLHGFGVKTLALRKVPKLFHSTDSMAWSLDARFSQPLPGHKHKNCANCFEYAMAWRRRLLHKIKDH